MFDPVMVVKILKVTQVPDGRARVCAHLGRAMCRKIDAARVAQRTDPFERRDPATPGDVDLQAVDGSGVEHALEIRQIPAVLPRCDVDAARRSITQHTQAFEVVGGQRLF